MRTSGSSRTRAIGGHVVVEHLSSGPLGDVYGCVSPRAGADAAKTIVKMLHASPADKARARFERELRICAHLRTPHTAPFLERGEDEGRSFFALQRIEGPNGRQLTESVAELPLHLGARVGRSLFVALAHVHAAGILHRDVKPENVIVHGPDHVFLVDFGIACVIGEREDGESDLTTQDAVLGSLAYAAPEQIDDAAAAVAGDLYAAGAVLYELACGRLPFEGPTGAAILSMKRCREAPRLSSRMTPPAIPAGLDALVGRLLARDPAQRPATAAQVVNELDAAMVPR